LAHSLGWKGLEEGSDPFPGRLDGSFGSLSKQGLELGEDLLDGIEIGAVGRQEEELGACGTDGAADGLALVTAEIVEDDDVTRPEDGHEDLLDVGEEALAVDRTIDDARSLDAVVSEGSEEGQRAPSALGRLGNQPGTAQCPAVSARHVGLGPGLVDKDQAGRVDSILILPPLSAPTGHVGTVLFAGVQAFF
jgi:hypothetical protein